MAIAPLPTPLAQLGSRGFAFSPPIRNIERNEWTFRRAAWSDLLIVNMHTGEEISIPRRFIGEISSIADPIRIVTLVQELEYWAGAVRPHTRRVIVLPVAVSEDAEAPAGKDPAPVIAIALHSGADTRTGRIVVGAVVISILGYLVIAGLGWKSPARHPARHALPVLTK